MWLFVIFCIILSCCECPPLILVYASPWIIGLIYLAIYAIRLKIKTGYFFPWEHREELKKKGIESW